MLDGLRKINMSYPLLVTKVSNIIIMITIHVCVCLGGGEW